jgi:hypothetical protein
MNQQIPPFEGKHAELTDQHKAHLWILLVTGLITVLGLVLLTGCARLHSTTWDPNTGERTSYVTCTTFFDGQSGLTKFQNRATTTHSNEWAAGTTIGNLNQQASSTNLNELIGVIVQSAVKGAK